MEIRKAILERDRFSCQKCGFQDMQGYDLELHHITLKVNGGNEDLSNLITLCTICHHYAPDSEDKFKEYITEKIDGKILDTFRRSNQSIAKRTKFGMAKMAKDGAITNRAPFGYIVQDKKLLVDSANKEKLMDLFSKFLGWKSSLRQFAAQYGLTTSGLIKLLQNRTYVGELCFDGQQSKGLHESILPPELFNSVQRKLKKFRRIKQ